MNKVYLKVPNIDEMKYRQEWMKDPKTMSYNAGYDLDINGYDKETGTISKTDQEMTEWYQEWIGHEPERFYAYIYVEGNQEPIGEIYYFPNGDSHEMGILIQDSYRGNGYAYDAIMQLEKIAFEENHLSQLTDRIPLDRENAIHVFQKAGFVCIEDESYITKEMYFNRRAL